MIEPVPDVPMDAVESLALGKFLLDRLEKMSRVEGKHKSQRQKEILFDIELAEKARGQSLYPLVRLLVPACDRKRNGKYQIGEKNMAKIYASALQINTTESEDGRKLLLKSSVHGKSEYAKLNDAVEDVVQRRYPGTQEVVTIGELNTFLDLIVAANGKLYDLQKLFTMALLRYSAREHKFIVQVICDQLKISFGVPSILGEIHKKANEKFKRCSDLFITCAFAADWNRRGFADIALDTALIPGSPFDPMRCAGFSNTIGSLRDKLDIVDKKLRAHPILIEEKIDGWRIMVHKISQDNYKLFTRNSNDWTRTFAIPSLISALNAFTRDYSACVLDGELVAVDGRTNKYLPFGGLLACAEKEMQLCNPNMQKTIEIPHDWTPEMLEHARVQYVVFDLLYTDTHNHLSTKPLLERRQLLDHMFHHVSTLDERIVLPAHKICDKSCTGTARRKVLSDFLRSVLVEKGEGIVVKDLASIYELGASSRTKESWCKVKPEDGSVHCDMVIIGAYYSKRYKRAGKFQSYLVAVRQSQNDHHLVHIGKVGTGFKTYEHDEIHEYVGKDNWIPYESSIQIPHLAQWSPRADERPDQMINDLKHAPSLEVTFAKLHKDERWPGGYTMRFPRNKRVRLDLPWKSCATISDLIRKDNIIKEQFDKQGIERPISFITRKPKRKYHDRGGSLDQRILQRQKQYSLFSGLAFQVLDKTKWVDTDHGVKTVFNNKKIQLMLATLGAQIVAYKAEQNQFVLASRDQNLLKLRKIEELKESSVIDVAWVFDCIRAKKLLPLSPHYFIAISKRHAPALANSYDTIWGLPMDKADITFDELRKARASASRNSFFTSPPRYSTNIFLNQAQQTLQLRNECNDKFEDDFSNFLTRRLKGSFFIVSAPSVAFLEPRVRFLGGTIVHDAADATHLLVLDINSSSHKRLFHSTTTKPLIPVDSVWLDKIVANCAAA